MIDVYKLFGDQCITVEDGKTLQNMIIEAIKKDGKAKISFNGVDVFMSPFFNASFGALLEHYSRQELVSIVSIEDLSEDGSLVLKRALENAEVYFNNLKTREAINEVMQKKSEE